MPSAWEAVESADHECGLSLRLEDCFADARRISVVADGAMQNTVALAPACYTLLGLPGGALAAVGAVHVHQDRGKKD
jgi:hypothetical protein